jgi:hypothetical protein
MFRTLLMALLIGAMGCSGGNGNGDLDGGDAGDGGIDGNGDVSEEINGDEGGGDESCGGTDCCDQPSDCPAQYRSASACMFPDGVSDCQGKRVDATCVNRVCGSVEVDDDSGCEGLKLNCSGHFVPVVCTAQPDQPVAQCKQDCTGNADCEAPFECNVGNGDCECPGGNQEANCTDNQDDDCDGLTDCDDGDCSQDASCTCTPDEANEASCGDGRDNDCDGDPDCRDGDCARDPCGANGKVCNPNNNQCECPHGEATESTCADGTDNDCDGATDCDDPNCDGRGCGSNGEICVHAACECPVQGPETTCTDGVDDDCDGLTDCEDTDCAHDRPACGLDLVGGISIGKTVPIVGSWTGCCIYTGHQIYEWPNPGEIIPINHHGRWFKAYTEGDCYFMAELMEGNCPGGCNTDQWCNTQDVCEDLPPTAHAGTLTVTGLGVGTKTIVPDANGLYSMTYQEACFDPDNSYTAASSITLTASGGLTPAFSMTVQGVDYPDPPLQCTQQLPPQDQNYILTWTPANDGSWIRVSLPTWHHAGMGSAIICEVPDYRGSLTIPAAMINYYLAAGAVEERTYNIDRFQMAVVDVGNGQGVVLTVGASRYCDYFHP